MILIRKNHYNRRVNKAGMQSSSKTGLVLKISAILLILLAIVVYKLSGYFKNEKLYAAETLVRNKVVLAKTSVSSQLTQLRNTLSSYENGLEESNINWVGLDPFFAIASLNSNFNNTDRKLKVSQILVRSNTPAEGWNSAYLEKALSIYGSKNKSPILVQVFKDKAGGKFLIIRFRTTESKELAVVGSADYFQKFFDLERGEKSTALLANTENILVAHSEGDYITTQTSETRLSKKKYLFEKEEIAGTNLIAMNYILKSNIAEGLAVPWPIVGVVAGFGCILLAILFYSLDPLERKIERYKSQERAQIYKDTLGSLVKKSDLLKDNILPETTVFTDSPTDENYYESPPPIPLPEMPEIAPVVVTEKKQVLPKEFYSINKTENEVAVPTFEPVINDEITVEKSLNEESFLALDDSHIDLADIEKALALDDFDSEDAASDPASILASTEILKENLTSQKISISANGALIDKPQFSFEKKTYKVDEFITNIRNPETQAEKKPAGQSGRQTEKL